MSSAELVKADAITSATLVASLASRPKPRIAEPITVAVLARFSPVAVAVANVAFCASSISSAVKPSLDKFVCSSATCVAVKNVVLPNASADSFSLLNSKSVAPLIARTFCI